MRLDVSVDRSYLFGVVLRPVKLATQASAVSGGGGMDGQTHGPRIVEGFVALGAVSSPIKAARVSAGSSHSVK